MILHPFYGELEFYQLWCHYNAETTVFNIHIPPAYQYRIYSFVSYSSFFFSSKAVDLHIQCHCIDVKLANKDRMTVTQGNNSAFPLSIF